MTTGLKLIRERRLEIFQEGLGRLGGASGEEPVQAGRDLFFGGFAQDAKDGRAVAIEDDGDGNDFAELKIVQSCRRSAGENRKRDFLFFEETRDFGLRLSVIERDGEEGHVLVLVSGGQFGEHGHFFAAGETPSGPEVEHNDFASVVGERVRFAREVVERKRRRRRRLRAKRIAGKG